MSLKLYQPATKSGIIDQIYKILDADANKYPLAEVTADINLAVDNLMSLALPASGTWQLDDSNQTDYPILTTDLVSGQRDYSFTADESGNLILDIYRVMAMNPDGIFYDIVPTDQQSKPNWASMPVSAVNYSVGNTMVDGQNRQGNPTHYDKTANGIFLDLIPDYSKTGGLKIFVNREATHFTTPTINVADNTYPGFDGRVHEYLVIRPAYYYAFRKQLKIKDDLANELLKYEGTRGLDGKISEVYGQRIKDERPVLQGKKFNYK